MKNLSVLLDKWFDFTALLHEMFEEEIGPDLIEIGGNVSQEGKAEIRIFGVEDESQCLEITLWESFFEQAKDDDEYLSHILKGILDCYKSGTNHFMII